MNNQSRSSEAGIIYNVTIKVDQRVADQWLRWLLDEHIPDVINTKCFTDYKVMRLLEVDDAEGPTYAVQYFALSQMEYDNYIQNYSREMRDKSIQKWGDSFIAFRSVMEAVK